MCDLQAENIYDVYDKDTGNHLFIATETGNTCCTRCCCSPNQSLVITMKAAPDGANWDNQDVKLQGFNDTDQGTETVMMMERDGCTCGFPFCGCSRWLGCCIWNDCCKQDIYVHAGEVASLIGNDDNEHPASNPDRTVEDKASDQCLGWITQPAFGGWCTPTLNIMERGAGETPNFSGFAKLEGPCFFGGVCAICFEAPFKLSTMEDHQIDEHIETGDMASLIKKTPKTMTGALQAAFTDSDVFEMEFKKEITAKQKALLLATLFSADYMLFERDGELCKRNDKGGCTTVWCNWYCCGVICPCSTTVNPKKEGQG